MSKIISLTTIGFVLTTSPAFAHLNPAEHGSFASGFSHPFFGADHILAMVAIGLWAAMLGGKALYAVPLTFVVVMSIGCMKALFGMPLPFIEPVVLSSVVVLGLLVALALPVSPLVGMVIAGLFAFFHGHAHGGEIGAATFIEFTSGFMLATALLHAVGITVAFCFGRMTAGTNKRLALRSAGGAIAVGGLMLIAG